MVIKKGIYYLSFMNFEGLIKQKRKTLVVFLFLFIYLLYFSAACAAASLAIGTLNGEQDT